MATVEVSFTPLPAHVRTARLVATAVARRSGVEEALLDEVRLAVGEACSRAVEAHRRHCPGEPVRIALTDSAGRFEVSVTDTGDPGAGANGDGITAAGAGSAASGPVPDPAPLGAGPALGLAVIQGLADDVQISETADGVTIRMSWPAGGARS
ncbi:MAG TPA: ATP-binding protein [Streptosporangiaceae bacterium]|jgi:serine/threonine-protein kinase RsbW|nr:ATP-binding protein [Streptosporangiaceae bacterium]